MSVKLDKKQKKILKKIIQKLHTCAGTLEEFRDVFLDEQDSLKSSELPERVREELDWVVTGLDTAMHVTDIAEFFSLRASKR